MAAILSAELDKLLRPKSIAVVGASTRDSAPGNRVVYHLIEGGFAGAIYPVNPRYEEVLGRKCYPSLADLPAPPDLVFAAIPAESVAAVLEEAGRAGVGAAVVNASGFADAGPDGQALQDELVRIVAAHSMALCGPNNNGYMNFADKVLLSVPAPPPDAKPGPVAVISHSGTVSFCMSRDRAGLGLACIVSAGNEAGVTAAEYLAAFVADPRVRIVLMFLETIRHPERFAAAAREAAALGKRLVAVKVGRSAPARAATQAHTGSLAGEDALYDAFFRRCGVARADDLEEMTELAALFHTHPDPPPVKNVVALTTSGGQAGLVADLGERAGLAFPPLAAATRAKLKAVLPAFANPGNPLDAWGTGWDPARFAKIVDILAADPEIGVILPVIEPRPYGSNRGVAELCRAAAQRTGRHFVIINDASGGDRQAEIRAILAGSRVPYLSGVRNGLAAVARWLGHRAPAPAAAAAPRHPKAASLARMSEAERFALLAEAGVPMAALRPVARSADARAAAEELGYPLVLKGSAPDLPHKTELGLVELGIAGPEQLDAAFAAMAEKLKHHSRAAGATLALQRQVENGVELLAAVRNFPGFGTLVVVGLGGTQVELLRETSVRLAPVSEAEALEMLAETRAGTVLAGLRGKPACDAPAAAAAIAALARLGAALADQVAAIEINPLVVLPRGRGALGVDLLIETF